MIKIINGDLIELFEKGEFNAIAQQNNLQSVNGRGIALSLVKKYPKIQYWSDLRQRNALSFGTYDVIEDNGKYIYCLYSQWFLGAPTNRFIGLTSLVKDDFDTRLKALKLSLLRMCADLFCIFSNNKITLGIPLIASGLARQKGYENLTDLEYFKQFILPTIEKVLEDYPNIELTIINYVK